jgi:hypothetical protein
MRWHHAGCRTYLPRPTPASFSTSTRQLRSMNQLFPSLSVQRVPARMQTLCLLSIEMPGQISVDPTPDALRPRFTAPSHLQSATSCLSPLLPQISAPDQTVSKYIAFHEGGFLQAAASEAPSLTAIVRPLLRGGAPDTALGLLIINPRLLNAPLGSVTLPVISPVFICPKRALGRQRIRK